ncbi:MAG: hypothetical protein LAT67_01720 [Balneolales bacterium]|nr:hypothetical protein [Balneolales bacterium]
MQLSPHQFHIPVMGLGFTIDSPIRVGHLGINSAVSIVDDLLLEKVRRHYSSIHNLPYQNIGRNAKDGRTRRVRAFLDMMDAIVQSRFESIKQQQLFTESEKDRYFQLLPNGHPLRKAYKELYFMTDSTTRRLLEDELTEQMRPGEIQVNIMSKVDVLRNGDDGLALPATYSDASTALRGFAESTVNGSLVLSAGFNPRLYGYLPEFSGFYRLNGKKPEKRVILKVSDFRSALIQGKFLAKKGIEVAEFRIESGINCGGHAFASDGILLPTVLEEFAQKKEELARTFLPLIQAYYEDNEMQWPGLSESDLTPKVTVQGGIGTNGEMRRLLEHYGVDGTGWGSPFLLVPEATCVDTETMTLLGDATEEDFYLSNVSPLGVPFNNVRNSGSEKYNRQQIENGKPGSKCPKGFLAYNTEFTQNPICTASAQYQLLKIESIRQQQTDASTKEALIEQVLDKDCLCNNLGFSALIRLGIVPDSHGRQSVCPGPNLAYFSRTYSMDEMVDHIYGRSGRYDKSIVDNDRPHMFAKELTQYVNYLEKMLVLTGDDKAGYRKLLKMKANIEQGMDSCYVLSMQKPFKGENLNSLADTVYEQRCRLDRLFQTAGTTA